MNVNERFDPADFGIGSDEQAILSLVFQLQDERLNQKISQRQLSKKANVSQSQLSRIENLESIPSIATVFNIAKALGKKVVLT